MYHSKMKDIVGLCSVEGISLESYLEFMEYLINVAIFFPEIKLTVL